MGGRLPPPEARQDELRALQPVLLRLVDARKRIRFMALLVDDASVAQVGEPPPAFVPEGANGEVELDGLFLSWRPLGAPTPGRPAVHPLSGGEHPFPPPRPGRRGTPATRPARGEPARGETWPLPPGAPVAVIGLDSEMPDQARRSELRQIAQKVGLAGLGVVALLAAWVQGIRGRALAHRLQAEQAEHAHLEELSLAASGLAHETKNPLGIIRGLAQRMQQDQNLRAGERERARQILNEADRAVARLGEFMSYARSREPELGPIDVREILEKAATVLDADAEAAGVTVKVETPGPSSALLAADRDMLLQILLNLLLNCLQVSEPGDTVTLCFEVVGHQGRLRVVDQGPGIDPDLLSEVFKPYVTGRSAGHGLGLAIVRKLVEQHGWTILLHSAAGDGTEVEINGIRIAEQENH